MKEAQAWPRRLVVARLIELGVILGLVGLGFFGYQYVDGFRREVAQQQREIEARPDTLQQFDQVQRDLRERERDIQRIEAHVLQREMVGDFVNTVETLAAQEGVTVTVTDIAEETAEEEDEAPRPSGTLVPVRVTVRGVGAPVPLLRFLHAIEHSQYMTVADEWLLQVASRGTGREAAALPTAANGGSPVQAYRSVLTADLHFMVFHEAH